MLSIYGKFTAKVDDKGRLVLPVGVRRELPSGGDQRLVFKKGMYDNCLEMYTFDDWKELENKAKAGLDLFFNHEHIMLWRKFTANLCITVPDPRLGRISIDRDLLDAIGISKEVVFSGVGFRMEVWAKESFGSSLISNEEFISIAKGLSSK
ncbi:MAG: hypothetical protein IJS66_06415 [Bacteroidales bacterium]|nr:hypothetical protein [Bacteroidales bacterium]